LKAFQKDQEYDPKHFDLVGLISRGEI
jgi:hypothetical protein